MEIIIFIGIPGSGKSTFYKDHFFNSHVRVSLDLLRTRNREKRILDVCFTTNMPVVLDNTNVSIKERKKYIDLAKSFNYKVKGYYFKCDLKKCIERNNQREGKAKIPVVGVIAKNKQLELPKWEEGFDELFQIEGGDGNNNLSLKTFPPEAG